MEQAPLAWNSLTAGDASSILPHSQAPLTPPTTLASSTDVGTGVFSAPPDYTAHKSPLLAGKIRSILASLADRSLLKCDFLLPNGLLQRASVEQILMIDDSAVAPELQYTPKVAAAFALIQNLDMSKFFKVAFTIEHSATILKSDPYILCEGSDVQLAWTKQQTIALILFENDNCSLALNTAITGMPDFGVRPPVPPLPLDDKASILLDKAVVPYVPVTPDRLAILIGIGGAIIERILHRENTRLQELDLPCTVSINFGTYSLLPERFFVDCFATDPNATDVELALRCLRMFQKRTGVQYQLCEFAFEILFQEWLLNLSDKPAYTLSQSPSALLSSICRLQVDDLFVRSGMDGRPYWQDWSKALGEVDSLESLVVFTKDLRERYRTFSFGAPLSALPSVLRYVSAVGPMMAHPYFDLVYRVNSRDDSDLESALSHQGIFFAAGFFNADSIDEAEAWDSLKKMRSGVEYSFQFRYEAATTLHILTSHELPNSNSIGVRMAFHFGNAGLSVSTPCSNASCWCSPFLIDKKRMSARSLLCLGRQILANWERFFPDAVKPVQQMVSQGRPVAAAPKRAPTKAAPP